jgi:hypothetical protein
MPIPTIIAAVSLVSLIGGGALYLGKPPYANEGWVSAQLAGQQVQIYQQRQDQLERRIFELQVEKSRGRWSAVFEQELKRLQRELADLTGQIQRIQGK